LARSPVTARRKKKAPVDAAVEPAVPSVAGHEVLRRVLLVLAIALIVARPLVLGEDPGQLAPFTDPWGLVLGLLWLVAALGWAVWRLWSGDGSWRGGILEGGLLAVAGAMFLSAGLAAHYQHPAWLIAWEWLILLLAFSVVRQLAVSPVEQRGLLAAVLATGVCVGTHAVYQNFVDLPRNRELAANPEKLREELATLHDLHFEADSPALQAWIERMQMDNVFASFAHPNSLASYLTLLLPAYLGVLFVCWRAARPTWHVLLLGACTLTVAAGLWLTHSRGAFFALFLVAAAVLALRWRTLPLKVGGLLLAALAGLAGLVYLGQRLGPGKVVAGQSLGLRFDYWKAAWAMIRDHPWLGVGPGNFGRHYPQYMLPTVTEKITDPHNFAIELWATGGVIALVGMLVALAAFFRQTVPSAKKAAKKGSGVFSPAAGEKTPDPFFAADPVTQETRIHWEYYLGGMAGLLLAFWLRTSELSPDEIIGEGVLAGIRSLIWFAAFALFFQVAWSGPSLVLALTAGVAACLLNLTVSGGIAAPSVAGPLWVVAALALNAALPDAQAAGWPLRERIALFLPLPVLACVGLVYVLIVFTPVAGTANSLESARNERHQLHESIKAGKGQPLPLIASIGHHLQRAREADPYDITPQMQSAEWFLELAERNHNARQSEEAVKFLARAHELDPIGVDPERMEFELRLRLAEQFEERRKENLTEAAALIDRIVARDPTLAAQLHFRLAAAYFQVKDRTELVHQAELALKQDAEAPGPAYRLPGRQLEKLKEWLRPPPPG
jgi:O-antigen ligase